MNQSPNRIKILTYNIELSKQSETILNTLVTMKKQGVDIFCLQEVCRYPNQQFFIKSLISELGKEWQAEFNLGSEVEPILNHGVAIIWNTSRLQLKGVEKIKLTNLKKFAPHEALFAKANGFLAKPVQRKALSAVFSFNKDKFRITSLHLDLMGGERHRKKQLEYYLKLDHQISVKREIICGDFNTSDMLNTKKEYKSMIGVLDRFAFNDASSHIQWSLDITNAAFIKKVPLIKNLLTFFNIHIYKKMDYIWCKGTRSKNVKILNIEGSDHYPLVGEFTFDKN